MELTLLRSSKEQEKALRKKLIEKSMPKSYQPLGDHFCDRRRRGGGPAPPGRGAARLQRCRHGSGGLKNFTNSGDRRTSEPRRNAAET